MAAALALGLMAVSLGAADAPAAGGAGGQALDKAAERWVSRTLAAMTLERKIGQMLVPTFESRYLSTDSDTFEHLARLVRERHVGGFLIFGGTEAAPAVLLNATYGTVTLGQPLAAASILNRLQALSDVPLLNAADFESGAGFRLTGATAFPRAMAFGAAGDERLAREAGRIAALESRAMGVHVNFAPVVDVNNNPRNPVINTRSFGEDPARVAALAGAYVRGLADGGAIATLKHFPGHGDTEVDTHLGLAVIAHPRDRLEAVELRPFRAAMDAGAGAVMVAHVAMPAFDASEGTPATLSQPIVTGLLRNEMKFDGLVYTDSMQMQAITKQMSAGEAAVRAVRAGNDLVLHSPNDDDAAKAIGEAVAKGEVPAAQIDRSAARILRAKALLQLHKQRAISLDVLPDVVGTRAHLAVADEISRKSMTLIKDDHQHVPLKASREASVLYLSVLDYPGNWRIGAPSRTFIPELKQRWPKVTAIELSDRSTREEIELVRAMAPRFDVVIASLFVRTASGSGRMDLAPGIVQLLRDLSASAGARRPFITTVFGNPYITLGLKELPAVLLTYDYYDRAERSAVRALAGETAIEGHLPIALPGLFPVGHGLARSTSASTSK